jgi:hypothetical protein
MNQLRLIITLIFVIGFCLENIAFGFTVLRSIICFFFRQFAKYLNVKDKVNFAESLWKTIFYILSFSFAVYIAYDYNMIFDQRNCWNDYGKKPKTSLLIYYYFIELGFYLHSIIVYFLFETSDSKKSDTRLILLHHFVTFGLIYGSFVANFERIGIMVLVVHDFSDIFLEGGKVIVYLNRFEMLKNIMYILLLIGWVITRLYLFPYYVIGSCIYQSVEYMPSDYLFLTRNMCIGALEILFLMHIYWFFLLLGIGYRKIFKGKSIKDDREKRD